MMRMFLQFSKMVYYLPTKEKLLNMKIDFQLKNSNLLMVLYLIVCYSMAVKKISIKYTNVIKTDP